MRYELYGVLTSRGTNVFINAHRSMKNALSALDDLNENVYPLFIILEKQRKSSPPHSCESGRTVERRSNRSTSFVTGVNPTHKHDGAEFWNNPELSMANGVRIDINQEYAFIGYRRLVSIDCV